MRASVVIPTCNRLADLERVLDAVRTQWAPAGCEVELVVVDDGSTDGTGEWLRGHAADRGLTVVTQANAGPAAARNRGVEAAGGDIVLFLGDDTVPQASWLALHLESHRLFAGRRPLAVLGYTSFPAAEDSPFKRYINEHGAQFGYLLIDDPRSVPFNFFYTSNISVGRDLLLRLGGFREDFPAAAWEDIELAYRARAEGLVIRYEPRARAIHHHCVRPRTFCLRQRTSGRSAAIFHRLHPELGDFLGLGRAAELRPAPLRSALLWAFVAMGERLEGAVPSRVYRRVLDHCYLRGLAEGLHRR